MENDKEMIKLLEQQYDGLKDRYESWINDLKTELANEKKARADAIKNAKVAGITAFVVVAAAAIVVIRNTKA